MSDEMIIINTKQAFVTAAHLTEDKRQYYELDLINEFSGERWVFMIPRDIFNMTIMNKRIVNPKVVKIKRNGKKDDPPVSLSI